MKNRYHFKLQDKTDYRSQLLLDAYKTLWNNDSNLALKLNAVEVIAHFIDYSDVRERVIFLQEREESPIIRSKIQEVLEGRYEKENDEDLFFSEEIENENEASPFIFNMSSFKLFSMKFN